MLVDAADAFAEDVELLRSRIDRLRSPPAFSQQAIVHGHHLLQVPQPEQLAPGGDEVVTRTPFAYTDDKAFSYKAGAWNVGVDFLANALPTDEATLKARTDALIAALDIGDIAGRRTEGFSNGQRVKTAIARALVHDPRNVLLDEPTNGLDVMATRSLRKFMQQLRAEGRCVLFSSHIMQEVAALCDRIVVIAHGKVVAQGSTDELREQAGETNLEDAFVKLIGSEEGLHA